jgi:hypothetical protein
MVIQNPLRSNLCLPSQPPPLHHFFPTPLLSVPTSQLICHLRNLVLAALSSWDAVHPLTPLAWLTPTQLSSWSLPVVLTRYDVFFPAPFMSLHWVVTSYFPPFSHCRVCEGHTCVCSVHHHVTLTGVTLPTVQRHSSWYKL